MVLIVIVTVAVPILAGFTESHPGETGENVEISDASTSLFELKPDSTVNITVSDDVVTMTINGTTTYTNNNPDNPYAAISKNFTATTVRGNTYIYYENVASQTSTKTIDISFDGTKATVDRGRPEVLTFSVDHIYVVVDKTDVTPNWAIDTTYVMVSNAQGSNAIDAYVNSDSTIVACRSNYDNIGACFIGTYDNIIENTWHFGDHQTLSFTYESDGDAIHLTSYEVNPSDTAIIYVPSDYWIEMPDDGQVSGPVADMINILPLIFVIGALIGAVGLFILNRRS